ncbi:PAS domain-containing protein [Streptomyces showdoensis]|uniref:PAS domain-containing protein n=1 Tax=Streptomyces showdoensis TaxID=68268 RepID=UPI000F50C2CB
MVLSFPRGTARLSAILDALPDGLVLVNRDGTVVNANTIALGMFETPGTTLIGCGVLDLLPSFDLRLIPGPPRRAAAADERGRTEPTRMIARRTDGSEFPAEFTCAGLEEGSEGDPNRSRTGDELLMLVVRDLTGTLDAEAELARFRRQTEMILRAADEGVVGTDTEGRVVLVNPAAGQILGYRADEFDGAELHALILARRADGSPFPYAESPLADTLRSGRKHRVRGQVLWAKAGEGVLVDLTTAPVRDGERLVGAVMTFTDRRPYEELVARHTAEREELVQRYDALASRCAQLTAALAGFGPERTGPPDVRRPEPRRREAATTAAVTRHPTTLGTIVTAGIDKASELTGAHRTRFAVHAPPVVVALDPVRASTALAHLIADASGVTSTGATHPYAGAASRADDTVVITAALRGDRLHLEISGPRAVNDPAHVLVAQRIVDAHGGDLTAREHPGGPGLTYVIRIPLAPAPPPAPAVPYLAHSRPPEAVQIPVAGSWIIGAAVGAHRDRKAARSRPYALAAEPAAHVRGGGDEAAQQRIVHLLARIRSHSA